MFLVRNMMIMLMLFMDESVVIMSMVRRIGRYFSVLNCSSIEDKEIIIVWRLLERCFQTQYSFTASLESRKW